MFFAAKFISFTRREDDPQAAIFNFFPFDKQQNVYFHWSITCFLNSIQPFLFYSCKDTPDIALELYILYGNEDAFHMKLSELDSWVLEQAQDVSERFHQDVPLKNADSYFWI